MFAMMEFSGSQLRWDEKVRLDRLKVHTTLNLSPAYLDS